MVSLSPLRALFVIMTVILNCINYTIATAQSQEQSGSAQGAGGIRGSGSPVRIVPSITISERYDSNVRRTTPEVYDYVSSIRPNLRAEYQNNLVQGTLTGGFRAELYARNPELNFVAPHASVSANLDNAAGKIVRGLGLRITDSIIYTPVPPAFVTPEAPETSDFHGIQVYRTNTLTNAANIQSTFAITPLTQFNASYSHMLRKFFDKSRSEADGTLFNTVIQSFMAGPQYQINPNHLIGASYQYQHFASEPNTGGTGNVVTLHGAMASWKTSFTRELTLDVSPGVSVLTMDTEKPYWTMRGSLEWSDGRTIAGLSYVRRIRPSIYINSSTLISDVVTASLSRNLTSQWSVHVQSSYAINKSISQTPLRFESFSQTGSVNYAFYPGMTASASITNYNFLISGTQNRQYDRQLVMISLTAEWD